MFDKERNQAAHISIHAPHEGERPLAVPPYIMRLIISIHAPHEGERLCAILGT